MRSDYEQPTRLLLMFFRHHCSNCVPNALQETLHLIIIIMMEYILSVGDDQDGNRFQAVSGIRVHNFGFRVNSSDFYLAIEFCYVGLTMKFYG